ncbi:transposase [Ileibacterium valens]|uniref:transposase n=1 Tax=Ileibacterium valens TaxID=1862668 RepID=UPI002729F37C|nr:transposase [Ileibacterium valens]
MKMKEDPVISLSLDENSDPVLLENARNYLSRTLNRLMMVELTEFLGYEKSARSKQPNARNGFYRRPLKTPLGLIEVKIPRDRLGQFTPSIFPKYSRDNEKAGVLAYDLCQAGFGQMEMYILAQKHFGIRYSERAQSEMYEIITEEIDHLQKEIRQENREVSAH